MGRTGHPVTALGVAAVAVAAAGTIVVLTRPGPPLAAAPTTVRSARHAVVIHADGSRVTAYPGERVRPGELVRTSAGGEAQLATRGRLVWLEPRSVLSVINGGHQQLRTGSTVVDARRGAPLRLDVAATVVSVPAGTAVEADRAVAVRVGTLSGRALLTGANGRRLSLPALGQAAVAGDALPTATSPLQLSDRPAEAATAPVLVADDESLRTLARGIDSTSAATAATVLAAWHGTPSTTAAGPRSERVLPVVIATATGPGGAAAQQRYDEAVRWRRAGGSWGVVLHLLGGRSGAVLAAFDALQRRLPAGRVGTVTAAALVGTGAASHLATVRPRKTSLPAPRQHPSTSPTTTRPPRPRPSPSPTGVVGSVTHTARHLIKRVLRLLPVPTPSGSGAIGRVVRGPGQGLPGH